MQRKYCPIAWGFIVDFAIGPVTQFVLNLPNGEVEIFLEEFKLQKKLEELCNQSRLSKRFWGQLK